MLLLLIVFSHYFNDRKIWLQKLVLLWIKQNYTSVILYENISRLTGPRLTGTVNWPTSYHLPGIIILIQDRLCREKYIMANCITLLDYSLKRLNFTSNFSNFMHVRTPSEPTKLYCTHVHVVKLVRPNCVLMCLLWFGACVNSLYSLTFCHPLHL